MDELNNDPLIRCYRAELHDDAGKVAITSDSLHHAQEKIRQLIGENFRMELIGTHTRMIYDRKGGALVGWITEIELPRSLVKKTAGDQVPAHVAA
jgi:hypothetical protein